MRYGRLIFDGGVGEMLHFREGAFLGVVLGGGGSTESLEEEARSWVETAEQPEEEMIETFGEEEYQWHQGFAAGLAEVMCTLAWVAKGIRIEQRGVMWPVRDEEGMMEGVEVELDSWAPTPTVIEVEWAPWSKDEQRPSATSGARRAAPEPTVAAGKSFTEAERAAIEEAIGAGRVRRG